MLLVLLLCASIEFVSSQALWTPIYVDPNSQIDLWTQSREGCRCPFDSSRKDCACCVKGGGCHCGEEAPTRCAQCGIQQHCTNMCNMTLDARTIISKSSKSYGQLKSPSVQGPLFCWYTFIPDDNHRIEIQIFRLISVGKYNGSSCEGGYVQLVDGMSPVAKSNDAQICGINERFTPPVLLFGDDGAATLIFRVMDSTVRSQFMAYYSFTSTGQNAVGPGFKPHGGKPLEGTSCDWMYHESNCRGTTCYLASPSFPGMYPPNSKCHYHITLSQHSTVRINFKALNMPHADCYADNVKIYKGPTSSSPLLMTICGNKKQSLTEHGPNILLEFSSGASVHPFDYSGFVAALEFTSPVTTTVPTTAVAIKTTEPTFSGRLNAHSNNDCTLIVNGNETRTGHFNSRGQAWKENCTVMFVGRETDVVHITLLNYHLRGSSCQTSIEVFHELPRSDSAKPHDKRICSPVKKHNREITKSPKNLLEESKKSPTNIMILFLRKPASSEVSDSEFVDGYYTFREERIEGVLQPDSLCDVQFFGGVSTAVGQIKNPGSQNVLWSSQVPVLCTQTFIPTANQSITLKVVSLNKLHLDSGNCQTACGDGGCYCQTRDGLTGVNHIKLLSSSGKILSCLCGDFQVEWLPVGIRSWSPISLVYSVAASSWPSKGFHFLADYHFHGDSYCGTHKMVQHSGTVSSRSFSEAHQLNYYYYQTCSWTLDSNVERQLTVDVESTQNRPCTAWNITLFEYNEIMPEKIGQLLHTFCPRDVHKSYELPWKQNIIVIRLNTMTRLPPEFTFKWKSQIVRTNTRLAGVTPVQHSSANPMENIEYILIGHLLLTVFCFV